MSEVGETVIQLFMSQVGETVWFNYVCHKWERQCDSGNYVRSGSYSVIQVAMLQAGFR